MNSLLLTAHDYRTPRKANMHFIADELARRGRVRFFSLRYSALSRRKNDPRLALDDRANRIETVGEVDCFLWKTAIHPFNTHRRSLRLLEEAAFRWFQAHPPAVLVEWMRDADVIFFESGTAIIHVALAKAVAPDTPLVYIASDDLATIDVARFVLREFERVAASMTALCLPSPRLAATMPPSDNQFYVPHGIDATIAERADPSPFAGGRHVVSVGSMLFDRRVLDAAAPAFPDVNFHVIGPGDIDRAGFPPNVKVYDEMAFDETLRYIKHAQIGLAPYDPDRTPAYLTETSMKLMQYRFFGIPAVCPASVTGDASDRFGYRSGSSASVIAAFAEAFASTPGRSPPVLDWAAVTDRLIAPWRFADTALACDASSGRTARGDREAGATADDLRSGR